MYGIYGIRSTKYTILYPILRVPQHEPEFRNCSQCREPELDLLNSSTSALWIFVLRSPLPCSVLFCYTPCFRPLASGATHQVIRGRTPCAFAGASMTLKPGQLVTITSAYGQTWDVETFNDVITPAVTARSFVSKKRIEAYELTKRLTKGVNMVSGSPLFDAFVKQAYLDNLLRGGMPAIMGKVDDPKARIRKTT